MIAHPDGSDTTFLAALAGTNSPLPGTGKEVAWSPDGKQIAFVSSTAGEGAAEASGDPMVITRYLYKPDAGEGLTRFNDNQRLHIFVVDIASKQVRQLTQGNFDEHSIDWSPDGKQLVFASNREPNQDEFFNYDLFTLATRRQQHSPLNCHRILRIRSAVVAGRQIHRLSRHAPRSHRPRNHHGRHTRLGDERRWQQSPRNRQCD